MSDDKKSLTTEVVDKQATDMSERNLKRVESFKEAGLPGILQIKPEDVARMADLYLSGKTYGQISQIVRINKDMVMYLAQRYDWYNVKQQYLIELEEAMRPRVAEARLMSQDFIMQLQQFFEKKIGKNIRRYLATDSDDIANELNLKDVAAYLKTLESLTKVMNESTNPSSKPSPIGLNVGDGLVMSKKDDGSVEITPKQKAVGDILKQFADSRREQENK
jgi:hypothetical protein